MSHRPTHFYFQQVSLVSHTEESPAYEATPTKAAPSRDHITWPSYPPVGPDGGGGVKAVICQVWARSILCSMSLGVFNRKEVMLLRLRSHSFPLVQLELEHPRGGISSNQRQQRKPPEAPRCSGTPLVRRREPWGLFSRRGWAGIDLGWEPGTLALRVPTVTVGQPRLKTFLEGPLQPRLNSKPKFYTAPPGHGTQGPFSLHLASSPMMHFPSCLLSSDLISQSSFPCARPTHSASLPPLKLLFLQVPSPSFFF